MTSAIQQSIVRYDHIEANLDRIRDDYLNANPFPHILIDDFLTTEAAEAIYASYPPLDEKFFASIHKNSFKYANADFSTFAEPIKQFFQEIHSPKFLKVMEYMTGIQDIKPDWTLQGGGMHQSITGGFLNMHADFTHHKTLKLRRALNILLYLNKDWKESYNGYLELWDTEMKGCVKAIAPIFNRCVIFSTTDKSFHGHPKPLVLPQGMTRKSLAAYYYTAWKEEDKIEQAITTFYQPLPHEYGKRFVHTLKKIGRRLLRKIK